MHSDSIFDDSTATIQFDLSAEENLPTLQAEINDGDFDEEDDSYIPGDYDNEEEEEEAAVPTAPVAKFRTRDPFTISEDGHFVGHDGFIVPKDFAEFFARYPHYVRNFVRRHMRSSEQDLEDRESDLLMHLMTLPENSKFRAPGFNDLPNGCSDRIEVFHPVSAYGASGARFFNYLNLCLLNKFCSLIRKASANSIRRCNSFQPDSDDETYTDTEYFLSMVSQTYYTGCHYDRALERTLFIREFVSFVEKHNPELLPVIDALAQATSFVEAQRELGMTEKMFLRARNRLAVLHDCFIRGAVPPRQRKVYRSRRMIPASSLTNIDCLVANVV